MSVLVSADLHFTDNPRDAHRWDLLPWLAKQAQKHKAEAVLLLGDLTDAKDKHSAALTNRMVRGLTELADVVQVIIIRGNHDYIDENEPFFGFMDEVSRDTGGRIRFLTKPTIIKLRSMGECLFLPNTRNYEQDWYEPAHPDVAAWGPGTRYIFTHQTYDGCLTENGTKLEGIPPSVFAKFKGQVWSGDIHKPQQVAKNIWYVGAPYRCRFGDDYTPRVVLLNNDGTHKDLHFPTKNKVLVKLYNMDLAECVRMGHKWGLQELYEGDQVKVRVELPRAQYGEWPALRAKIVEQAAAMGLELTGPELVALAEDAPKPGKEAKRGGQQAQTGPRGAVAAYARQKGASDSLRAAGLAMLAQAQGGGK